MKYTNRIPLALFLIGILFIGLYGIILSVIGTGLQIYSIRLYGRTIPTKRQPKKLALGTTLFLASLICFSIGLCQFNSYFGGVSLDLWLAIGMIPLLAGSIVLFTIPTSSLAGR